MSEAVVTLLMQVPLAGVVAFVVWMFLDHVRKSEDRQDAAQKRMIEFLTIQEEANRIFLREQREQNSIAVNRLADQMGNLMSKIEQMNGILVAHDARAQVRLRKGASSD